jgi:hypothetical protein
MPYLLFSSPRFLKGTFKAYYFIFCPIWFFEKVSNVAESPGLARFQGACLSLETKCPEGELN